MAEYQIRDLASRASSASATDAGPGSKSRDASGRRERRGAAAPAEDDAPAAASSPHVNAAHEEAQEAGEAQEGVPRRVLAVRSPGLFAGAGRPSAAPSASQPASSAHADGTAGAAGSAGAAVGPRSARVRAVDRRKAAAAGAAAPTAADTGPPAEKVPDAYADDGYWES